MVISCCYTLFYSLVHIKEDNDGNPRIFIDITGKNLKMKNFLGGEWISQWIIGDGKIAGNISAKAHYFEEGNV